MIALGVIIGIIVILAFVAISYKNKFVVLDNRVKNSWSQIDVQMQKLDICLQLHQKKKWKLTIN